MSIGDNPEKHAMPCDLFNSLLVKYLKEYFLIQMVIIKKTIMNFCDLYCMIRIPRLS
jgi:hypothetical protein